MRQGFESLATSKNTPMSGSTFAQNSGYGVRSLLKESTSSTLVTVLHLAPTNAGALQARVTVTTWSTHDVTGHTTGVKVNQQANLDAGQKTLTVDSSLIKATIYGHWQRVQS